MQLPDTNVLLYSVNPLSPHRDRAAHWLENSFNGAPGIAFAWLALVGFIRLSTHRAILPKPLAVSDAVGMVDEWLSHPRARIIHPTERHADVLARLLLGAGTAGNLTNGAHLAALAIEHGCTVGSFDHDFKLFSGVKLELLM